MLTKEFSETKKTWIELRQQANYWKMQHGKSIEREKVLRAKIRELEVTLHSRDVHIKDLCQQFNKTINDQNIQIKKLSKHVEELKAQNVWLKQRIFGRQTEQRKESEELSSVTDAVIEENAVEKKRPRGQQKGSRGHGRKSRENLPTIEVIHDLEEHQKHCPLCELIFQLIPITQDSQEIHYEVRVSRIIHKRLCYVPGCDCGAVTGMVVAPAPVKLIPKGMFTVDFWLHILAEKFLFQRPMSRILQTLSLEGLDLSQGTITGGLEKIKDMVYPLYTRILERSRQAKHWHMDETRWMMFVVVNGKTGYRWWLWVVVTKDTVVYILDPSRSSEVPRNHLGDDAQGIISADRYSAYKSLANENLKIAFCWGHVRRDFDRIYNTRKKLRLWANEWLRRINEIFHLNNRRLEVFKNKKKFQAADKILRNALDQLKKIYVKELKSKKLHMVARKALLSLRNHWSGLLIFVDHPQIPMDNNISERALREAALGRKNYYGCASQWSGDLTAALFTIFKTARLNHLHPKKFLKAYLDECALNKGKPPENIDDFLPWNLSEEQKNALRHQKDPP